MKKDEPPFTFPKTLEEFEYAFNDYGQLRHTKTGDAFIFNAREDLHRWNQKRYEALGEVSNRLRIRVTVRGHLQAPPVTEIHTECLYMIRFLMPPFLPL
uniref:Arb2 domain-containing protein n=1 Tax=Hippocampus comes TaxID=109280 RepID=A0A3Q2YCW5_HIPCM